VTLHAAFQQYLDELNPLVQQAALDGVQATPESARAALAGLNVFAAPAVPIARVYNRVIGGRMDATGASQPAEASFAVPVRVYVPQPGIPSDVVLFVHGGGHMAGDLDVYDFSARRLAAETGMVIVSVDYRRSPETPFPGGLEDVYHVLQNLDSAIAGESVTGQVHAFADSGGAAKVASIAMRVAEGSWSSPIDRQVLLYPSLDYTLSGSSITELESGFFLSADRVRWYFDHYFPAGSDRRVASPLFGAVSDAMPETLVIVAEYDPLRSEAESYVTRLHEADARAHLLVAPGMIHAFAFFETKVPEEVARLYQISARFLRNGAVPERW
jgi:acetyl esterase/lipase